METGSIFGSYTYLFGWYIFDMIVGLLQSTALWLMPFFFIFYEATIGQAGSGSYRGYYERSLGTMEVGVYVRALVIAVALTPVISVDSGQFTYTYNQGGTETIARPGDTNTTYDNTFDDIPASIQVPLLWYGISSLASGINAAIRAILPDEGGIRQLLHGMSALTIGDQSLQEELRHFNTNCYYPALATVNQFQLSGNPSSQAPAQTVADYQAAVGLYGNEPYGDLSYIGARQLVSTRGLYQLCTVSGDCPHQDTIGPNSPVAGWDDLYDFTSAARVGPSCYQWWSSDARGLKRKLVEYIRSDRPAATSYFDDVGASLGYVDADDRDDTIIIRALGNTDMALESDAESNDGWFDNLLGGAAAIVLNGLMSVINGFIVDGLPLFQAYLVMIFTALLPLVMLVTLYSPKPVIALSFFLMAILLWPGLWAIAGWVDDVLLGSIYSGYSFLGMQLHGSTALLSIVAMLGYTVLPAYFTKMLVVAGMQAGEAANSGLSAMQSSVTGGVGNVSKPVASKASR